MGYRAALLLVAAATAAPVQAAHAAAPAAVSATPAAAGARNVTLVVTFPTALRCGRLNGDAPVTIRLPAAMRVPRAVSAGAVRIGDESAGGVSVSAHTLVVAPAAPRGMAMCDSIRNGSVSIRIHGLANPRASGSYRVVVARGGETFAGRLRIV